MSEYMVCEVEIRDTEALKEALQDMGVNPEHIEVHESPVSLNGFMGDARRQRAHVVIRRQNVGQASNDIGFEKTAEGSFKAWVSDFDRHRGLGHRIMNKELMHHYSKRKVLRELRRQRGAKIEKMEEKNGKVRIKVSF